MSAAARKLASTTAIAAASLIALAASPSYAAVLWTQPSGTSPGATFAYSGGGSDFGLFGNPVVTDTGFSFFPSQFSALSQNGFADTRTDRLFVTISLPQDATSHMKLVGISVSELGDYSILGSGSVKVTGLLTATILGTWRNDPANVVGLTFTDTMDPDGPTLFPDNPNPVNDYGTSPLMPVSVTNGSVDGQWSATMLIPVPDNFEARSLQIVMNNVLQATTATGGTAFIEKKVLGVGSEPGLGIHILVTPEPATLSTLALAVPLMLRRRRARLL